MMETNQGARPAFQLLLAPIRGCTDAVYRTAVAELFGGLDRAVAPFVSVKAGHIKQTHLEQLMPESNPAMPLIPQILTSQPDAFVTIARQLHALGYATVNWNLGCPFKRVVHKGLGSGMLPHPELIEDFLKKIIPASPVRISIKMRLGLAAPDEILAVLPVLNRYSLEEIIIHPRTGLQMYSGPVNLEMFEQCLSRTPHRILYNGDIGSPETFQALLQRFPQVSGWMLGRGVLADPFLPARIKAGAALQADAVSTISEFHARLFDRYSCRLSGPAHIVDKMRPFWEYLSLSFEQGHRLMRKLNAARRVEQYQAAVESFFALEPVWRGNGLRYISNI